MYKNKEERIELIDEMRSTHALQEQDMNKKKLQKQDVHAAQYNQRKDISRVRTRISFSCGRRFVVVGFLFQEDFIDSILQTMEGEAIGDMLDYLSKELIRLQEERRIAAFAMLAERQRRLREAEESGLRQVEERRRREHDELFKQVRFVILIEFCLTNSRSFSDAQDDTEHRRYLFRRCHSCKYF